MVNFIIVGRKFLFSWYGIGLYPDLRDQELVLISGGRKHVISLNTQVIILHFQIPVSKELSNDLRRVWESK